MRQIDGLSLWIGTARDARDLKNVLSLGIKTDHPQLTITN
jgi:hypothetical protein